MIPEPSRTEPAFDLRDREMLEAWLEYHRATLQVKCVGLTAEQLRERSAPPSTLSLAGLLRHMTDVERGWFGRAISGEELPALYYDQDNPDGDFDDVEDQDPFESFQLWHKECQAARYRATTVQSLDSVATNRSPKAPPATLRWILTHMIEEYARHNGHADILRERIDGRTDD